MIVTKLIVIPNPLVKSIVIDDRRIPLLSDNYRILLRIYNYTLMNRIWYEWMLENNQQDMMGEKYQTIEKTHGRIEKRSYWLMDSVEGLEDSQRWLG